MLDVTAVKQVLLNRLPAEEGNRLKPYKDSVGKTTIGIGRNLDDVGISMAESLYLCSNDLDRTIADLDKNQPWWRNLDNVRASVLLDMAFNMGDELAGHGLQSFVGTLSLVSTGNYSEAAAGMRTSTWAKQVGQRAQNLANMMENGV